MLLRKVLKQRRAWLSSQRLQWRFQVFTVIGFLAIFAYVWWVGQQAIADSTQKSLNRQLTVASLVASLLDRHLVTSLTLLETTAAQPSLSPQNSPSHYASLLRDTQSQLSAYDQRLFWLDRDGNVLWTEPFDASLLAQPFPDFPSVCLALENETHQVSNLCYPPTSSQPYILLAVPVSGSTGKINSLLVEMVNIDQLGLAKILDKITLDGTTYIEVVDHNGVVLASNTPGHDFSKGDHTDQFARLISNHQPIVGECHQCHPSNSQKDISRIDEVLAFAPLETAPWGVAVRQPASEVLAPANRLQQQMLWGGGILLIAALLVSSWFIRYQIAAPIQALDKASAQLAAGNLATPIRKSGIDEVARLTTNLEQMRVRLEATLEDHRRWNETLEDMVEERTRELTALYEQLEGKAATCKQLLGKVMTAQEEERTRLARELHDTIGQSLTAIIMASASVEKQFPPNFPAEKKKLAKTRSIAAQALQDLRNVIADLRPDTLDDLGLVMALRIQVKEHLEAQGLQVNLKATGLQERLPADVEIVIFRVVQEAITNIARHARASEVTISLIKKDNRLIVRVEDDGIGFDRDQVMNGQRQAWGLRGMEERIILLGGKFHIEAKPGNGTMLMAEVPLEQHCKISYKGIYGEQDSRVDS